MTTEQKSRIISLRNAGYGYAAVAREIGMSKSAVRKYCQGIGMSGAMEKHDLQLPESRANVVDTKGSGITCKVTYVFADEPNENVVPEVIRILSNVSRRQEALK